MLGDQQKEEKISLLFPITMQEGQYLLHFFFVTEAQKENKNPAVLF